MGLYRRCFSKVLLSKSSMGEIHDLSY